MHEETAIGPGLAPGAARTILLRRHGCGKAWRREFSLLKPTVEHQLNYLELTPGLGRPDVTHEGCEFKGRLVPLKEDHLTSPSLSYDVVIATCNRPALVKRLLQELDTCRPTPRQVLVVDSSDEPTQLLTNERLRHLHTQHKCQPFQRYLGARQATSEVVVFLDDDLQVLDRRFPARLLALYGREKAVGAAVGMDFGRKASPRSSGGGLTSWLRRMSGAAVLQEGEIWLCGLTGSIPEEGVRKVEWFSGGVMSFRRDIALKLFDSDLLFDLFLNRWAMGEDKYLSMGTGQDGVLWFDSTRCFRHPPGASTYSEEESAWFHSKVAISRLWLSRRFAETRGYPGLSVVRAHYLWYSSLRLFRAALSVLYRKSGRHDLYGLLRGFVLALWGDLLWSTGRRPREWPEIDWDEASSSFTDR